MRKTQLVATVTRVASVSPDRLQSLCDTVDWLELRGEECWDLPASWLRQFFTGKLIYSLGSRESVCALSNRELRQRLSKAAEDYDLVDINFAWCDAQKVVEEVPVAKRLITSWKAPCERDRWLEHFHRVAEVKARFFRLVVPGECSLAGLGALEALSMLSRSDVITYGEGEAGIWSRVMGVYCGAPMIFGGIDESEMDDPSILRFSRDYGMPYLRQIDSFRSIIGTRVSASLSPRMHNTFCRELGERSLFVPLNVVRFHEFWQRLPINQELASAGLMFRGFTAASPFKEAAANNGDRVSPLVRRSNSSNLVLLEHGYWNSETSDWVGLLQSMRSRGIPLRGQRAAVVGSGGAGRVMACGLVAAGAEITLFNRDYARGLSAQTLLGLRCRPLHEFRAGHFTLIVNATSVGKDGDEWFLSMAGLSRSTTIVDLVYRSTATPLVLHCRRHGNSVISGDDILRAQVAWQFNRMTGRVREQMKDGYEEAARRRNQVGIGR